MNALRILVIHNRYQQRGGEDEVVDAEINLLREQGHLVNLYQRDNREIAESAGISTAVATIWSAHTRRDIQSELAGFQPNLVHVHNTFPLISPSVYWAVSQRQIPIVQTLHNFRLLCVQAMFLREGSVCEDCLGSSPWRGVVRGCYRGSRPQSGVLAMSVTAHRTIGTFRNKISRYIALNEFCRNKFIAGGLPAERICVKPNFVDIPPMPSGPRKGALFVGRLSPEKGTDVMLRAMCGLRLTVIGTGPDQERMALLPGIRNLGWQNQEKVYEEMSAAAYLVMPSIWYENFPRTLVEAFACGLPVIASRIGALEELINHGHTGLLFEPNSAESLRKTLEWAEEHPEKMREMGVNARHVYENKYTPVRNYEQLISIYKEALSGMDRDEKIIRWARS